MKDQQFLPNKAWLLLSLIHFTSNPRKFEKKESWRFIYKFQINPFQELSYTEVAILMSSPLGKIQFQKSSETQLKINQIAWEDNDNFICKNYESAKIKEKVKHSNAFNKLKVKV